jgi:hypothetical protein
MARITLPLGHCRASLMRALKLIFDGQAIAQDLSIGNFDLLGIFTLLNA